MNYTSFTGQPANLDVDVNFMYRQPLWAIHHADSHPLGGFQAKRIPVLDLHELVAGKLSALFSRRQARDLFDCHHVLEMDSLHRDRLRIAFVVYGGMNRKDWRTVSPAMSTTMKRNWQGNSAHPPAPPAARTGGIVGIRQETVDECGESRQSPAVHATPSAHSLICCWRKERSTRRY